MTGVLCDFVNQYNVKLGKDALAKMVLIAVKHAIDNNDIDSAIGLLQAAKRKGVWNEALSGLLDRIETAMALRDLGSELYNDIVGVVEDINRGYVSSSLQELEDTLNKYIHLVEKAESLSLDTSNARKLLNLASDVNLIASMASDLLPYIPEAEKRIKDAFEQINSLGKPSSVEDFAADLSKIGSILYSLYTSLHGRLSELIDRLESAGVYTDYGRKLRDSILSNAKALLDMVDEAGTIGSKLSEVGASLENLLPLINDAYTDVETGPFAEANEKREEAIQLIATILSDAAWLKSYSGSKGFTDLAHNLGDALINLMKHLKYTLVFGDYRWNSIWEEAESKSGVDLGNISEKDYYMYKYDPKTGELVKRSGISEKLLEHLPEKLIVFFTDVENFLKNVSDYNAYALKHTKGISHALAALGVIGASALMALGQILAPKLVAENLNAMKELAGKWLKALRDTSGSELKEAANETYKMFFGSEEAVLSFIGMLLAGMLVGELLAGKTIPMKGALQSLALGDPVGATIALIEEYLPLERLAGIARSLVSRGEIRLRDMLDDADILKRALKYAERSRAWRLAEKIGLTIDEVKEALKKSRDYDEALKTLREKIEEDGAEAVKREAEEFTAVKTAIESNISELRVSNPKLTEELREAIESARRGEEAEVDVPGLSEALDVDTARVWKASELDVPDAAKELGLGSAGKELGSIASSAEELAEAAGDVSKAVKLLEENAAKLGVENAKLEGILKAADRLRKLSIEEEERRLAARLEGVAGEEAKPVRLSEELARMEEQLSSIVQSNKEFLGAASEIIDKLKETLGKARSEGVIREELEALSDTLKAYGVNVKPSNILAKLGDILSRAAENLMDRIDSILEKAEESGSLDRVRAVGLEAARRIFKFIKDIGDHLKKLGLERQEKLLVKKLADLIETRYLASKLARIEFLESLVKGLREFLDTPYGAMLRDLVSNIEEHVEHAAEKLESLRSARLGEVACRVGEEISRQLEDELVTTEARIEKLARELLREEKYEELMAGLKGLPPDKVTEDVVRRFLGPEAPEDLVKAIVAYERIRGLLGMLEKLKSDAEAGKATIEEVQRFVDELAKDKTELAAVMDWGFVSEAVKEALQRVEEAAEKYPEISRSLSNLKDKLVQLEEYGGATGTLESLERRLVIGKTGSGLVAALEDLVADLKKLNPKAAEELEGLIERLKEGLAQDRLDAATLEEIARKLRGLKLRMLPKALLSRIKSYATKLAEKLTGKYSAALHDLADVIEEASEEAGAAKGWTVVERVVETGKARVVAVPEELAGRIARILATREKEYTLHVGEDTVRVKRTIEVKNGVMKLRYEIEFPGGRKIVIDESSRLRPDGSIRRFHQVFYDPELVEDIAKYLEEREHGGSLSRDARVGRDVLEVLKKSLREIDPDYELLEKLTVLSEDGEILGSLAPKPSLEWALKSLLAAASASASMGHAAAPLGAGSTAVPPPSTTLSVEPGELPSVDAEEVYKDLESVEKTLEEYGVAGVEKLPEKLKPLASMFEPIINGLAPLYSFLEPPSSPELPVDVTAAVEHAIGDVSLLASINLPRVNLSVELVGPNNLEEELEHVLVVVPRKISQYLALALGSREKVKIPTGLGVDAWLPAVEIPKIGIAVVLPPAKVEIPNVPPVKIQSQAQAGESAATQQAQHGGAGSTPSQGGGHAQASQAGGGGQASPPPPPPPPSGGGAGAPGPVGAPAAPIPAVPWDTLLSWVGEWMQREKLYL